MHPTPPLLPLGGQWLRGGESEGATRAPLLQLPGVMAEDHIARVVEAVRLVYTQSFTPVGAPQRREADAWLCQFQRQAAAWQVSDQLLHRDGVDENVRFFAAQTLHTKIRHDFSDLPPDAALQLRESLLQHLVAAIAAGRKLELKKLRLAVAALAAQMNWQTFPEDILSAMQHLAPGAQQWELHVALLGVIEVVPDEAKSRRLDIDPTVRREYIFGLERLSGSILKFMESLMTAASANVSLQTSILRCMRGWVQHCRIPAELLVASPAFGASFTALDVEDLFDEGVETVVEILRGYEPRPEHMTLIASVVPRILELAPRLRSCQDVDERRGLTVIFTEMGESYAQLLVDDHSQLPAESRLAILDLLLNCTRSDDPEVSRIPLNFWFKVRCRVFEMGHEAQDRRLNFFAPAYAELLQVLLLLSRHPADSDAQTVDSFAAMRENVADSLDDCCIMLGAQAVFQKLCEAARGEARVLLALPAAQQLASWRNMEAALFCVAAIHRRVVVDGVPSFFETMALLPQLPPAEELRKTMFRCAGYYAKAFNGQPALVEPTFALLLGGVQSAGTAHFAAHAFRDMCEECADHLRPDVLSLFDSLPAVRAALALQDELAILRGLCAVVRRMPTGDAVSAMDKMTAPSFQLLGMFLGGQRDLSVQQVQAELDRVTAVVQHTRFHCAADAQHPALGFFEHAWPLLRQLLERQRASAQLVEAVCRLLKHIVCCAKGHLSLSQRLEFLLQQVVELFGANPHGGFLYLCSVCIGEYAHIPASHDLFVRVASALHERVGQLIARSEGAAPAEEVDPSVIEEHAYLVARCLEHMPVAVTRAGFLAQAPGFLARAMQVKHRDAHRGVLFAASWLVRFAQPAERGAPPGFRDMTPDEREGLATHTQAMLEREGHGKLLVTALLATVVTDGPFLGYSDGRVGVGSVIWGLLRALPGPTLQWFKEGLRTLHGSVISEDDAMYFVKQVQSAEDDDECGESAYNLWSRSQQGFRRLRWQTAQQSSGLGS